MSVKINGKTLQYILKEKTISCDAEGDDQIVDVDYTFNLV